MSDREGNENAAEEIPSENLLAKPTPPASRLSVIHLLSWTTVVAVLIAITGRLSQSQPQQGGLEIFRNIFSCALWGIAICSLFLIFTRRWRGLPFPVEPGEWILVTSGFSDLIHLAAWAVWNSLSRHTYYANLWPFQIGQWLMLLPDLWAIHCVQPRRWKGFFWASLLLGLTWALVMQAQLFGAYSQFQFASAALIILTVSLPWRTDRREGIDRGWLHRVGLAFAYLSALNAIIFALS
jgi:hypothetical protein